MKIVLTGGGTGGHFYPIIAIAEEINRIVDKEHIVDSNLYYFSDSPFDKTMLYENGIRYEWVPAGKWRLYPSIKTIVDMFKLPYGILVAIFKLYRLYPDVVVGKGGYASFPTLFAAKLLRIPVIIHESDTVPGKVSKWAGKFAKKIAISYQDAIQYFPKDKTAWTGQPVRATILNAANEGAKEYLKLEEGIPVIALIGGSQGAMILNNVMLDALPDLVNKYEVIHQTGTKNYKETTETAEIVLGDNVNKRHYKPYPFLNDLASKMVAGAADIIISRAGSAIFEFASWGVPSIIIPITKTNGDHQKKNAYAYARGGACEVIEESNLTSSVLETTINDLLSNPEKMASMQRAASAFFKPGAGQAIAEQVVKIALSHES
ncbi:MAG: UDP-N-acetylglucosamine--N-acetylmuramyl-(pentapeptide) pyrophosphoryl-undecaprenol N-acetylglucosamine transferase [Candidatus Pacebacteria bacterium]|jgi:UDP-N-acetylglucosamine--N-acetylmuramyl-(pentapeptide) pyrophosphoryl-undecaprenol N-acetylglucosamine transferase|nr:UDP-N-acetylglucosamine--N-acetylmuramyl-(pentapeptide) pyrophosphoryl-undecaprenol N-acetylglucosamine transferase [Candidatus Paceibacterota bacterium]